MRASSNPTIWRSSPPKAHGELARIHLVGVFALFAASEPHGTMGASITVGDEAAPVARLRLVCGRHYSDSRDLEDVHRLTGDGASIETVGKCEINGVAHRVDQLTFDVPPESNIALFKFWI